MRALITGAAGFIGSTLAERLLYEGWTVRGIDCFTPYYDSAIKRANLRASCDSARFEFIEEDLAKLDLGKMLEGIDVVFHHAAQPGVRLSWAKEFQTYSDQNILVTQQLLEAARASRIRRFIYASSSSVYGNSGVVPTPEDQPKLPYSPYGVTKLAGELLCLAYATNFDVPVTSLRYFTVYGPRQRPDMAIHRMIEAAFGGTAFPLFGNGQQIRDFTFIDDVVEANILAANADISDPIVCNIAGGSSITLLDLVEMIQGITERKLSIDWREAEPGDVRSTGGEIARARERLGWKPRTMLQSGLERQIAWHLDRAQA